jgi:pyruvate/2-oxoglutarate dehydrogenase complex dihydrolipoamide dehydrogenase (E3) component
MPDTYNFVVTGAGSAGCAIAGRLAWLNLAATAFCSSKRDHGTKTPGSTSPWATPRPTSIPR